MTTRCLPKKSFITYTLVYHIHPGMSVRLVATAADPRAQRLFEREPQRTDLFLSEMNTEIFLTNLSLQGTEKGPVH